MLFDKFFYESWTYCYILGIYNSSISEMCLWGTLFQPISVYYLAVRTLLSWPHPVMCAHSVVSHSLWPHSSSARGIFQARVLGCHFLLQAIFPTQVSNALLLCLLHRQAGSLPAEPSGKPHPWDILWLSHTVLLTSSLDLGSVFWKEKGQGSTIRCGKLSEVGGQVKSSALAFPFIVPPPCPLVWTSPGPVSLQCSHGILCLGSNLLLCFLPPGLKTGHDILDVTWQVHGWTGAEPNVFFICAVISHWPKALNVILRVMEANGRRMIIRTEFI